MIKQKNFQFFSVQLEILSKVSHVNVVKLLGYCDTTSEQILIYEFMNDGTLKHKLTASKGIFPLYPLTRLST